MARFSRRSIVSLAVLGAFAAIGGRVASAAQGVGEVEVYKSPYCGCCGDWIDHMRDAGFELHVIETEDLDPIKARYGVEADLQSCHTAVVDGYVIEGHVPAADVKRLLAERPSATGLTVPGMPVGSPGMEQGGQSDPYQVILFSPSGTSVYASY